MSTVIYIVLAIVVVIVVLAIVAPKNYNVSRSISINKPLSAVFSYLKLINNQDHWSPWAEKDPNMIKTFSGIDGEVGFVSAWVGNKDVGEGEPEITGIVENEVIESQLRFLKPFKSTSDAYLKEANDGNGTLVTWVFVVRINSLLALLCYL